MEISINNSTSKSTGFSPFFLNYGFEISIPVELEFPEVSYTRWGKNLESLTEIWKIVNKKLVTKRVGIITYVKTETTRKGDQVMLSTKNLPKTTSKKLSQRWIGPFEIIDETGGGSFKLELSSDFNIHPVFHSSLLKKYHPPLHKLL